MKRKIFQHKLLVYGLAFFVLAIGIINAAEIADYNREIYVRQENQANGVYTRSSFAPSYSLPPIHRLAVIYSALVFLSLIISRRIVFSLFFTIIFSVQYVFVSEIFFSLEKRGYYFSYSEGYLSEGFLIEFALIALIVALSFWLAFRIDKYLNPKKY
jgi:hypothetical protein